MEIAERQLSAYLAHDALAAKAKYLLEQKQHNETFALTFTGMLSEPTAALNYAAVYRRLADDPDRVLDGSHWGVRDFDHLRDWARLCRYIGTLLTCSHTLYKSFVLITNRLSPEIVHLFWGMHTVAFAGFGVCGRVKVVLTQHRRRADQSNSLHEMPRT